MDSFEQKLDIIITNMEQIRSKIDNIRSDIDQINTTTISKLQKFEEDISKNAVKLAAIEEEYNRNFTQLNEIITHLQNSLTLVVADKHQTQAVSLKPLAEITKVVKPSITVYFKDLLQNESNIIEMVKDKRVVTLGPERLRFSEELPFISYLNSDNVTNKDVLTWTGDDWKTAAGKVWASNYTTTKTKGLSPAHPDIIYVAYIREKLDNTYADKKSEQQLSDE